MGYKSERKFSDRFLPEVTRKLESCLGVCGLKVAPKEEDVHHATDLMTVGNESIRVGVRIRRNYAWLNFLNDFTIRSRLDTGSKTELSKILDGWGDYLFYGFAGECESKVVDYHIINLKHFRAWAKQDTSIIDFGGFCSYRETPFSSFGEVPNGDGTYFVPYDVRKINPVIIKKTTIIF